jgi:hypothetical protein
MPIVPRPRWGDLSSWGLWLIVVFVMVLSPWRMDRPGSSSQSALLPAAPMSAESLDEPSILDALRQGQFYSTMGPEIYNVQIEGQQVTVCCSPAHTSDVQAAFSTALPACRSRGYELSVSLDECLLC